MAIRKPDFIKKDQIVGRKIMGSRPYRWGPGIPSEAIKFEELPLERVAIELPKETGYLVSEVGFYLLSETGNNLIEE